MNRVTVDETGAETVSVMSKAETDELKVAHQEFLLRQAAFTAEQTQIIAAKASGLAKLAALGFTEAEIAAW